MAYLTDFWVTDPGQRKLIKFEDNHPVLELDTDDNPNAVLVHSNHIEIYVINSGATTVKYKDGYIKTSVNTKATRPNGIVSVYRYDNANGNWVRFNDIQVGINPIAICQGRDTVVKGKTVSVVYVANYASNSVTKIVGGEVVDTIKVGTGPRGVACDSAGNVYVSNHIDSTVTVIDNLGNVDGVIDVGDNPIGIACDQDDNVFVACSTSGVVTKIKHRTKINDYEIVNGKVPYGVAVGPHNRVWVSCFGNSKSKGGVVCISPDSNEIAIKNFIETGWGAAAISVDKKGSIYVVNTQSFTLSKITDGVNSQIIANYKFGTLGLGDGTGLQNYAIYGYDIKESNDLISYNKLDDNLKQVLDSFKSSDTKTYTAKDIKVENSKYHNVQEAIDGLSFEYIAINSFKANVPTRVEKGTNIYNFKFLFDVEGDVGSISINGCSPIAPTDKEVALPAADLNNDTTYTLTATSTNGEIVETAEVKFEFLLKNYLTVVTNDKFYKNDVLDIEGIDYNQLIGTLSDGSFDLAKKCTIQNPYTKGRLIIAVPKGKLEGSHVYVNGLLFNDFTFITAPITNAKGSTDTYDIYVANVTTTASDIDLEIKL